PISGDPCREDAAEINRDLRLVLDEELSQLPDKYREPLVLCYMEGRSNTEAASQLGWPSGTVKGRLSRARDILRSRLARRGLAFSAGMFAVLEAQKAAGAAMSWALVSGTVQSAMLTAAGKAATGGVLAASA